MKKLIFIFIFATLAFCLKAQHQSLWYWATQYYQLGDSTVEVFGDDTLTSPVMVRDIINWYFENMSIDSAEYADTAGYALKSDSSAYSDSSGYALASTNSDTAGFSHISDSANYADTALYIDTAQYALISDSANHSDTSNYAFYADSSNYADSAAFATNTIKDSVYSELTATDTLRFNNAKSYSGDITIDGNSNDFDVIADSIDLFTNNVQLGNTSLDSTSVKGDTLITPYIKSSTNLDQEADTIEFIANEASIGNTIFDTTSAKADTVKTTVIEGDNLYMNLGTTKAAGKYYSGAVDPTNTVRTNYDGYFHATALFADGGLIDLNSLIQLSTGSGLTMLGANQGKFNNEVATATNPIYLINRNTDNTGIGGTNAYVSLIDNGFEALRTNNLGISTGNLTADTATITGAYSAGGGDVRTTTDTIDAKVWLQSQEFDSISVKKIKSADDSIIIDSRIVTNQYIGQLYVSGDSTLSIGATGTYYTFVKFVQDIEVNTTLTDSTITALAPGYYSISDNASYTHGTNSTIVHHSIFINDIEYEQIEAERKIGTGGDTGNSGNAGIVWLNTNDVVKVKFKADNTGTITVTHLNFHLFRL